MIPTHLEPVYNFLKETGIGNKDYCLFTNPFIGQRTGLAPKTVGDHLRALEALKVIVRTMGPPPGAFEPGARKVRRIYWADHPLVKTGTSTTDRGFEETPEGLTFWHKRYPNQSGDPIVPPLVLRSREITQTAKLLLFQIAETFGSEEGDAPPEFFAWALGLDISEVLEAFSELKEAGIVWFSSEDKFVRYGLVRDLYRAWFYYQTVEIKPGIVNRAELLFASSVFGDPKKYAQAVEEGQGSEPPGQKWPSE